MSEWCRHMIKEPHGTPDGWIVQDANGGNDGNCAVKAWKFCPICGAERPKEKRLKLGELLYEKWYSQTSREASLKFEGAIRRQFEAEATAAIEAVCELIDEEAGARMLPSLTANNLKEKLRSRLL